MTAETIHTCSYYCERPGCVRAQRDELRDRLEAVLAQQPAAVDDEMVSLGGTAPPVPRWLLDAVQHIEQYMDAHSPGDWAIGGIQKRQASEQAAEIEALRAEVAAWRELSDHVRVGACAAIWPDRYTDARTRDVAAALKRAAWMAEAVETLRAELEKVTCELTDAITRADRLAEALRRYRNEVPLGHQPHMLAHEVDDLLRDQEGE